MRRCLATLFVICAALASAVVPQGVGLRNVATVAATGSVARPLDAYSSNLLVATSMSRRLLTSYTGPLFRVKRSSDNAEQDIYAAADGWADTAALASFVGANDGDVRKIYDQDGTPSDFGANGSMYVVLSGTNQTLAGKLSARQTGGLASAAYQTAFFGSYTGTTLSCFARAQIAHTSGYARWISVTDTYTADYNTAGNIALIIGGSTGTGFTSFAGVDLSNVISAAANTDKLVSGICDGSNVTLRDGTNTASAAYTTAFNITSVHIAGYITGAAYGDADGYYAETIIWTSDQTANEAAIRAALNY